MTPYPHLNHHLLYSISGLSWRMSSHPPHCYFEPRSDMRQVQVTGIFSHLPHEGLEVRGPDCQLWEHICVLVLPTSTPEEAQVGNKRWEKTTDLQSSCDITNTRKFQWDAAHGFQKSKVILGMYWNHRHNLSLVSLSIPSYGESTLPLSALHPHSALLAHRSLIIF